MLAAVGAGLQGSSNERTRPSDPGGTRKALRSAGETVSIEGRDRRSVGILAKAKTQLDRRVGQGTRCSRRRQSVILTDASVARPRVILNAASNASGRKWLLASGQLRDSGAGTGSTSEEVTTPMNELWLLHDAIAALIVLAT